MARTEPLNEDGRPHIMKLEVEHEMEDKNKNVFWESLKKDKHAN